MAETSDDRVLEALRHEWDDAYEFGTGPDGFWARRRDGLGGALVSEDPGELRRMVSEDHAMHPPRRRPGGAGTG